MKKLKNFLVMLPVMFLFGTASDQSMFLKIENIPGEATDKAHRDWINLLAFKQGVSSKTPAIGIRTRGAGVTEFNDLVVTKNVDKATPLLMQKCATGEVLPEVIMTILSDEGSDYYTILLKNVMITSVTSSAECIPPCEIREEVSFSYSTINWEYSGKDGGKVQAGFDVKGNRKM